MKHTICLLAILLFTLPAASQSLDNCFWGYWWKSARGGDCLAIEFYSHADESNDAYQTIRCDWDVRGYGGIPLKGPRVEAMIGFRMEGGRILANREEYISSMADDGVWKGIGDRNYLPYEQTEGGEIVLYDFNMKEGDKYPSVEGHDDISVVSVENMTTRDGVERRLLTLSNGYKLLEGVGCLNSPGLFYFYLNPTAFMTENYSDLCLHRLKQSGKENIYEEGDEYFASINGLDNTSANEPSACYDLQGRRVTGTPRPSIYIQEGLKRVVRKDHRGRFSLITFSCRNFAH